MQNNVFKIVPFGVFQKLKLIRKKSLPKLKQSFKKCKMKTTAVMWLDNFTTAFIIKNHVYLLFSSRLLLRSMLYCDLYYNGPLQCWFYFYKQSNCKKKYSTQSFDSNYLLLWHSANGLNPFSGSGSLLLPRKIVYRSLIENDTVRIYEAVFCTEQIETLAKKITFGLENYVNILRVCRLLFIS